MKIPSKVLHAATIQSCTSNLPSAITLYNGGAVKCSPFVGVSNIKNKWQWDNFFTLDIKDNKVRGECFLSHDELNIVSNWISNNKGFLESVWFDEGTMSCIEVENGLKKV